MALPVIDKRIREKASVFAWEGRDRRGTRVKGETRAANSSVVRAELRRQGVAATRVRKKSRIRLGSGKKRIKSVDISLLSRQLATMMAAGVPLVQAFDILGRGHDKPAVQELVLAVKSDVERGAALTNALRKHPKYFDDLFCGLVAAGEQSGALDTLLGNVATYREKTETLKAKIKKALLYPAAVVLVAVTVTIIIMLFVIPQFKDLFESFGADLPAFTRLVIAISDFLRDTWWAMASALGIAGWSIARLWKRSRKMRELVDRLTLNLPVVGNILHKAAVARFSRTLSTTLAAGVPLVEALGSVADATGSLVYAKAVGQMREEVATGQALQRSMRQRNLFPYMLLQMTAIGEESGALDGMLAKAADFYEEQVDNAVDGLSSLLEPLIMVVIGVLVGGLVIAMYLPVFKLAAVV